MALGEKRTCPSCSVKYYDLGKSPAICPKCSHAFDYKAVEKKVVALKPKKAAAPEKPPKGVTVHLDETDEDIDLTAFDDGDKESGGPDDLEVDDVIEPEEEIGGLEAVEDREPKEDIINSDDGEEEAFIEEMDQLETLIDQPDDLEDEEDLDEDEDGDEALAAR